MDSYDDMPEWEIRFSLSLSVGWLDDAWEGVIAVMTSNARRKRELLVIAIGEDLTS